jgi:tetratricopeptide (TPR) repeat protein
MSHLDRYGLPISTSSAAAAEAYSEGLDLTLSAWPGAATALERAVAADPDFALSYVALGRVLATYGQVDAARAQAAAARRLAAQRGTDRERSHVEAIALTIEGRPAEACAQALAHLDSWPADALVLSLLLGAYGLLAFSGRADHDKARVDVCERVAPHYGDDWWFLGYRGWSHIENGGVGAGRDMVERSLATRRANANAAHALAHALFEQGAPEEADAFLVGWLPAYDRSGWLHAHLFWHRALSALERDDAAGALAIYQDRIQPKAASAAPMPVLADAASLLWRLDLYGHAVPGETWDEVARLASRHFSAPGLPFAEMHVAFVAAATGDRAGLEGRVGAWERKLADGALPHGSVAAAICRAIAAFAEGDIAGCAALLEPVAGEAVRLGGSHAQREVIEDLLLVALMKSGASARARTLLDWRLHRRPSPRDARWREALGA